MRPACASAASLAWVTLAAPVEQASDLAHMQYEARIGGQAIHAWKWTVTELEPGKVSQIR